MKLIGAALSPWVRRVMVVLDEKNVAYEHEVFFPPGDQPEEFRKKSPLGLIPVLETEEGPLADSTAICTYLEARFPSPSLTPDAPYARARSAWFCEYADALFRHEGTIFFQKVVRGHLMKQEPDRKAVAAALAAIPPFLAYLDAELEGRSYLVGDAPQLCDITVASVLLNLLHTGEEVDPAAYPHLRAFLGRMFRRPSFAARIDADLEILGGVSSLGDDAASPA